MALNIETYPTPTSFFSEDEIVIQMLSDNSTFTVLTNKGRMFRQTGRDEWILKKGPIEQEEEK